MNAISLFKTKSILAKSESKSYSNELALLLDVVDEADDEEDVVENEDDSLLNRDKDDELYLTDFWLLDVSFLCDLISLLLMLFVFIKDGLEFCKFDANVSNFIVWYFAI